MPEMKTLNGFEIVDAKAREDIANIGTPDLTGYAKTSDIPTTTSQLTNNSGYITSSSLSSYATKTYVDNAIAGVEVSGGGTVHTSISSSGSISSELQTILCYIRDNRHMPSFTINYFPVVSYDWERVIGTYRETTIVLFTMFMETGGKVRTYAYEFYNRDTSVNTWTYRGCTEENFQWTKVYPST